eukprot:gb/GFBE01029658.1/.p1 GENE.gb/GFBE01029658.1/~~gb/GFBE01029658.1/.p1  ORF type:complete len:1213 (+),score=222.26 gb/GFBE01029658.1/:1-3639(+)
MHCRASMRCKAWNSQISWLFLSLASRALGASLVDFMGDTDYNLSHVQELAIGGHAHGRANIRVGASLQLDCCSKYAAGAKATLRGYELGVEYVNEVRGGILLNGKRVGLELTMLSDYSEVSRTESNIRSLVARGFHLFLGPYGSTQTNVVAGVVNETNGTLLLAAASSNDNVYEDRPRVFSILPSGSTYLLGAVEALYHATTPSQRHAMVIMEDHSASKYQADGAKARLLQLGFAVHGELLVLPFRAEKSEIWSTALAITNFTKTLALQGEKPILMAATYDYETCLEFVRAAKELGLRALLSAMVFTQCVDKSGFSADLGSLASYVSGVAPWDKTLEVVDDFSGKTAVDFTETFQAKYTGLAPDYLAASAFSAITTLCWAIEETQSSDAEVLRAKLMTLSSPESVLKTVFGVLHYDHKGQAQVSSGMLQMQGSEALPTLIQDSSPLIFPMPQCNSTSLHINYSSHMCEPCELGSEYWPSLDKCIPCPSGQFSSKRGVACSFCPSGSFSSPGQTACTKCPRGYFGPSRGLQECMACPAGFVTDSEGQNRCEACGYGNFTDADERRACSSCQDVLAGSSTVSLSSTSNSSCVCPEGTYETPHGEGCAACAHGLVCPPRRHVLPAKELGYYSEFGTDDRELWVFRCMPSERCPASEDLQACKAGFSGRACMRCSGATEGGCGRCNWALAVVLSAGVLLGLYILYCLSQKMATSNAHVTAFGFISIVCSTMQSLSIIFDMTHVELPASVAWLRPVAEAFFLRVGDLAPACNFGDGFAARLYTGLSPWPITIFGNGVLFVLLLVLSKMPIRTCKPGPVSFDAMHNSVGLLFGIQFLLHAKFSMAYHLRLQNPAGPDTLQYFPDVIAYSEEHLSMLWLHILQLSLCTLAYFSYCAYLLIVAPSRVADAREDFLRQTVFLLKPFRPRWFYWGCVIQAKHLVLLLIALLVRRVGFLLPATAATWILYCLAESCLMPWHTRQHNWVDGVCNALAIVMMVLSFALLPDQALSPDEVVSQRVTAALMIAVCISSVWASVLLAVLQALRSSRQSSVSRKELQRCESMVRMASTSEHVSPAASGLSSSDQRLRAFAKGLSDDDADVISSVVRIFEDLSGKHSPSRMPCVLNLPAFQPDSNHSRRSRGSGIRQSVSAVKDVFSRRSNDASPVDHTLSESSSVGPVFSGWDLEEADPGEAEPGEADPGEECVGPASSSDDDPDKFSI